MEHRVDKRDSASWQAVLAGIIRDPDYRAILVVLLFVGLGVGLTLPYISLWVTDGLGGTTAQAAYLFVPFGVVGTLTNIIAGVYSDRVSRRKSIIVAALIAGGLIRIGLAFVSNYPLAVFLFALTGFGPFALIFALLADAIAAKRTTVQSHADSGAFITTLERTSYSLGWLLGPVAGGIIISVSGYSGVFVASGSLFLLAAVWGWGQLTEHGRATHHGGAAREPLRRRELFVLLLIFLLGLFLLAGDTGRALLLSLYLTGTLHLGVSEVSWAFSITVLAELLFIPIAGRMADRFGVRAVLLTGVATQALYFIVLGFLRSGWAVLLLQVTYAFVVATSSGVAIVYAQRTLPPERGGLTTSTYFVSRGIAPLLNSLLIGSALIASNISRMFISLGVLAWIGFLIVLLISYIQQRGEN